MDTFFIMREKLFVVLLMISLLVQAHFSDCTAVSLSKVFMGTSRALSISGAASTLEAWFLSTSS